MFWVKMTSLCGTGPYFRIMTPGLLMVVMLSRLADAFLVLMITNLEILQKS